MKKYIIILLSFVLSFSFVNCGGGGGGSDAGGGTTPVINKNSLAISTSSLTFDAAAGQQTVNVTANCDWKVSTLHRVMQMPRLPFPHRRIPQSLSARLPSRWLVAASPAPSLSVRKEPK